MKSRKGVGETVKHTAGAHQKLRHTWLMAMTFNDVDGYIATSIRQIQQSEELLESNGLLTAN